MAGITSIGTYITMYRLKREEIASCVVLGNEKSKRG